MTDNIEKLAKTLNRRMHTVAGGKVDVTLEIGEMVGSSLKVSVGKIPKGQYSVLSHTIELTKDVPVQVSGGSHSHTAKIVSGTTIEGEAKYSSGDAVLVAWAEEEPVIVGRID